MDTDINSTPFVTGFQTRIAEESTMEARFKAGQRSASTLVRNSRKPVVAVLSAIHAPTLDADCESELAALSETHSDVVAEVTGINSADLDS